MDLGNKRRFVIGIDRREGGVGGAGESVNGRESENWVSGSEEEEEEEEEGGIEDLNCKCD